MNEHLTALDTWLKTNRPLMHAALRPGATPERLDQLEQEIGVKLPVAMRTLLEWHDGADVDADTDGAFQHNMTFMCTDEIAESCLIMRALKKSGDIPPDWFHDGWIPFLQGAGGDHLCVDTVAVGVGKGGQVVYWSHEDGLVSIDYPSLESWARVFAESLRAGVWAIDEDENFGCNEVKWAPLLAKLAPGYPMFLGEDVD